jgi:hypothetical protein
MSLYGEQTQHAAKRVAVDHAQWLANKHVGGDLKTVLATGKSGLAQVIRDCWQLSRGPGRLSVSEYVRYQLYRPGLGDDQKRAFLSDRIHWPLCNACSTPYWRAATEDKWLSYTIFGAAGIPVPETLAVYDPSLRSYGMIRALRNSADIRDFLTQSPRFPIFIKPNDQIASFGVCVLQSWQHGNAALHDGAVLTPEEMIKDIFGSGAFLFQRDREPS